MAAPTTTAKHSHTLYVMKINISRKLNVTCTRWRKVWYMCIMDVIFGLESNKNKRNSLDILQRIHLGIKSIWTEKPQQIKLTAKAYVQEGVRCNLDNFSKSNRLVSNKKRILQQKVTIVWLSRGAETEIATELKKFRFLVDLEMRTSGLTATKFNCFTN